MRIVNKTDQSVYYTLKGGPLNMILSCCELDPGEEEVWETPRWAGSDPLELEVEIVLGKLVEVGRGSPGQTLTVEGGEAGLVLSVA